MGLACPKEYQSTYAIVISLGSLPMCAPSYEYLDCGLKGCLYAVKQAQLGSRLQIMTMHEQIQG
jgi:hypothetical protein